MAEADRALLALEPPGGVKPVGPPATATIGETQSAAWDGLAKSGKAPISVRTVMLIIFNIFQTVGFYGFSNWVPTLLIKQGISITQSLQYTFIIAIAAPFGPLARLRSWRQGRAQMADRRRRRSPSQCSDCCSARRPTPLPLIALGVLLTLSNNILSFSFHGYQAELYPTRIRAMAVGFVYSWSRLSAVFSAFAIAFSLQWFGVAGVFTLIAGSMLIVMLSIGLLGPRTSNLSLDAISK